MPVRAVLKMPNNQYIGWVKHLQDYPVDDRKSRYILARLELIVDGFINGKRYLPAHQLDPQIFGKGPDLEEVSHQQQAEAAHIAFEQMELLEEAK